MSHAIRYIDYHCSATEKQILKDLNRFAYDPQERSGYHGGLTFHRDIVCKTREEAEEKNKSLIKRKYDDQARFYKEERRKFWLVKGELHC